MPEMLTSKVEITLYPLYTGC